MCTKAISHSRLLVMQHFVNTVLVHLVLLFSVKLYSIKQLYQKRRTLYFASVFILFSVTKFFDVDEPSFSKLYRMTWLYGFIFCRHR